MKEQTIAGWQPIETVPENSNFVFVWCEPTREGIAGTFGIGKREHEKDPEGKGVYNYRWSDVKFQPLFWVPQIIIETPDGPEGTPFTMTPTHWAPMPTPPGKVVQE